MKLLLKGCMSLCASDVERIEISNNLRKRRRRMEIVKPDKYDIKIEKNQDNYMMIYREFFLKGRENVKEALENTYKIVKNYPFKVKKIEDNRYCGFEFTITSSLPTIADFITSEFLTVGNVGNITLSQIFITFGAFAGRNKKKEEKK
jgi:hypothetical protein